MVKDISPQGFFVTGTDTEVGKTLITAALIFKLQSYGFKVCGYKPVVAGMSMQENKAFNEDLETLMTISNLQKKSYQKLSYTDICPYLLVDPAAPHLVAKRMGIDLSLDVMINHFKLLQSQHDYVVVEGAGGFLVPISESLTLADLAKQINFTVILVVDIKLGCINHTLLTVESIRHRELDIGGWIANSTSAPDEYYENNRSTLITILKDQYLVPYLGSVPFDLSFSSPYTEPAIMATANFINFPLGLKSKT